MTRFKLNARFFGGTGLFIMILLIIVPVWLGLLQAGVGEDLAQNLVQFRESEPATNPFPFLIGAGVGSIVLFLVLREQKKRTRR